MSLRDQILNRNDITSEIVEVPEWDVSVEMRGMTGADRAAILQAAMLPGGGVDLQSFFPDVIIACAHDPETGERLFTAEDRTALMGKSGKAIDRLATSGLALSGMTEAAQTSLGKGLPTTENDDSTTS